MKKITFKNKGGGYRVVKVEGDKKKETWGKIEGDFIFDYQFNAVCSDIKKDKFKIAIV